MKEKGPDEIFPPPSCAHTRTPQPRGTPPGRRWLWDASRASQGHILQVPSSPKQLWDRAWDNIAACRLGGPPASPPGAATP